MNAQSILDIPADVLREDIADRSSEVSKAYRRGSVALAHFGDKLAVGAVGIGDKPVIHFAHTKHLIHKSLWIAFAQSRLKGQATFPGNDACTGRLAARYRERPPKPLGHGGVRNDWLLNR
mgnify:CR=1 FL=1